MKSLMKKLDYIGILLTLPAVLYCIAVTATYKTSHDVYQFTISHTAADWSVALIALLGCVIGPVLLMISYARKESDNGKFKSLIPFIISVLFFLIISFNFVMFFKGFSIRLFAVSALYTVIYSTAVLIKKIVTVHKNSDIQ